MSDELPKGWAWQELSKVAAINMGQSPPSESYSDLADQGLPFFQGCGDFGNQTPLPKVYCKTPLKIAEKDSILISVRAPVGVMNRADRRSCIGRGLAAIMGSAADTDFLNHSISLYRSSLSRLAQGTTFEAIGSSELNGLRLPLPPLPTQRRIAAVLRTVDEVIEATEARIEKQQAIKQGLLHDLFTRGVTPDGQLRPPPTERPDLYQESELGLIPKEWEVTKIGESYEVKLGKMLSRESKTGRFEKPYLGNRAVQWDRVNTTDLETMDFLPHQRDRFLLKIDDLLVCEGGEVGRTAIWRGEIGECYYQKALHRLRPNDETSVPRFLLRFMRYAVESNQFSRFTSSTSIAHLTHEKLMRVPIPKPDRREQERIAERFDLHDARLESDSNRLNKLRQLKSALMQDLLTGRVSADAIDLDEILPE